MQRLLLSLLIMGLGTLCTAQELIATDLLKKSIEYHDPNGNWNTFSGELQVTMETPKSPARISTIKIDLPSEYFTVSAVQDTVQTTYTIHKGDCTTSIKNPKPDSRRTPCETAELYKNYYTYLYGLPMKLEDPGTRIDPKVQRKTFKGKEYLVLKASYDAQVGSDIWFFYFDPTTYAMEIYQFYKGDPNKEGKDTGEYILLTEEAVVNDIKMPKIRAWYYNKDDKYLGTDILKQS